MNNPQQQRGEGKVGCIVSLLVLSIVIAAAFQFVPVLFSNNDFISSIESIAGRAAIIPQASLEAQINEKARDLKIPEALAPGAVVVTKSGDNLQGTCNVRIKYTRKVDFYGIFTFPYETDKVISVPYMNAR